MSDANRVKVSFVQESTFRTVRSDSNLQVLRHVGESLKQDTTTIVSDEIRSDRQIADIIRTGVGASGDINFELSFGTYDKFLQAVLCSSNWSTEVQMKATTISASAFDNALHDSGAGFVSAGFQPNQWIYVSGFTTTGNNGWAKIVSVDTDEMVISHKTLVDEVAGDEVTVQMGAQIVNGTQALSSWNIERHYLDLSPDVLSLFLGMCLNTLSLNIPADAAITGSMSFMGSEETSRASSAGLGYSSATVTKILTGANHVDHVFENASEVGILNFALNITNNLRQRLEVGTPGVKDMGTGTIEVSGTLSLYLSDTTLFDKYLNQSASSLAVAVRDSEGNGYVIEIPSLKLTEGARSSSGLNTDVVGEFSWRAFRDVDEDITIRIARFPSTSGELAGLVSAISGAEGDVTVT